MPTARSSTALKSGEFVSDQFPAGLRVLVVDDDPTCLRILEKMLQFCLYEVTKCNRAEIALSKLRGNKNGFDVVISDVHMPDMDGFKLLEHIGLEMDLPVIMMSADEGKDVVMKGVTHGACDYLIKPVRIEALKNIWQHVVRRKKNEWKDLEQSGSVEDSRRLQKNCDEVDYSSSANEGNCKNSKRKDDEEEAEDREDTSTLKKPRVVWSVELHQQFVAAVNQLGIEKAVPKKILELMNVSGLTRENVASHLQKYRLYLRRLSGVSPHHSNLNNSFGPPQEVMFGPIAALNGIDLQALAVAGKFTPQSLASLQASAVGRSSPKSSLISDQRNIFSFENPQLGFGEALPQHVNSSKPINLFHGISTSMEAKQVSNLSQSVQSHGAMNMQGNIHGALTNSLLTQMAQPQSSVRQSIRIPAGVLTNNLPRPETSMFNFPMNQTADFPENSLPFQTVPAIVSPPSKGAFLEESNLEVKQSGRFVSNYDLFDDLHEQKSRDWNLQTPSLNFNSSHGDLDISSSGLYNQNLANGERIIHKINVSAASLENGPSLNFNSSHGDLDISSSGLNNQNLANGERIIQKINVSAASLENGPSLNFNSSHGDLDISSSGLYNQNLANGERIIQKINVSAASLENGQIGGQQLNSILFDNPVKVKVETISDPSCVLFQENFDGDDLMSTLLRQQQENFGPGPAENEYDVDRYSMDNIPV